jgi:hypothetical protein
MAAYHDDPNLLHAIFSFSQQRASEIHTASDAESHAKVLQQFVHTLQPGSDSDSSSDDSGMQEGGSSSSNDTSSSDHGMWPDLRPAQLAALTSAVSTINSSDVELMPKYGCALLVLRPTAGSADGSVPAAPSFRLGQLSLYLVGLDGWGFRLHRWVDGRLPLLPLTRCLGLHAAAVGAWLARMLHDWPCWLPWFW